MIVRIFIKKENKSYEYELIYAEIYRYLSEIFVIKINLSIYLKSMKYF